MDATRPTVIQPVELADFIQFILEHHASPSTLIVCLSQDEFLRHLSASIAHDCRRSGDEDAPPSSPTHTPRPLELKKMPEHRLVIPTLHQISRSHTLQIAYCPSLESLRAYLSVYGLNQELKANGVRAGSEPSTYRLGARTILRQPLLALLYPISIHRFTSSFSAQGLARTFASAVEAAHRAGQRLVVAQCPSHVRVARPAGLGVSDDDHEEPEEKEDDPWEEQVAILNVTTRSFGAGERGWVGRTVKVRQVAERWCSFSMPMDIGLGM